MYRIAFTLFGHPVHWYGVCIALGFLAASWLMVLNRRHADMKTDEVFDFAMLALAGGILGARIFYVIQFWTPTFSENPLRVFKIWEGGLVFYGGLILAFIFVLAYAIVKKKSFPAILDMASPAIAVGHAFGRIGCFLEGCCFGGLAPADALFKVVYPKGAAAYAAHPDLLHSCSYPVYPVQLFESAANFILCAGLLVLLRFVKRKGIVAGVYFSAYAVIRFTLEFFRGDHTDSIIGFTPSQFIALFIMFPLGVGMILFFKFRKEKVSLNA